MELIPTINWLREVKDSIKKGEMSGLDAAALEGQLTAARLSPDTFTADVFGLMGDVKEAANVFLRDREEVRNPTVATVFAQPDVKTGFEEMDTPAIHKAIQHYQSGHRDGIDADQLALAEIEIRNRIQQTADAREVSKDFKDAKDKEKQDKWQAGQADNKAYHDKQMEDNALVDPAVADMNLQSKNVEIMRKGIERENANKADHITAGGE